MLLLELVRAFLKAFQMYLTSIVSLLHLCKGRKKCMQCNVNECIPFVQKIQKSRLTSWWLRNSWKKMEKFRFTDLLWSWCCGSLQVLSWGCYVWTDKLVSLKTMGWNQGEKECALLSPTYLGRATANGAVAVLIWISPPWICSSNNKHLKKRNKLNPQLKCPGSRFPDFQTALADTDFLYKMILEQLHLKCQSKPLERGQVCKK